MFAEYVAVIARTLYPLVDAVSFTKATTVVALSIAVQAIHRITVDLHDSVLVVGMGTIVLLAVQILKYFGCIPVIVVDIAEYKLEVVLKLIAEVCLNSHRVDVGREVRKHVGRGVDVAIKVVGVTDSVQDAFAA